MKKIVILSRDPVGSEGLAALLNRLFPECDICMVSIDIEESEQFRIVSPRNALWMSLHDKK